MHRLIGAHFHFLHFLPRYKRNSLNLYLSYDKFELGDTTWGQSGRFYRRTVFFLQKNRG